MTRHTTERIILLLIALFLVYTTYIYITNPAPNEPLPPVDDGYDLRMEEKDSLWMD